MASYIALLLWDLSEISQLRKKASEEATPNLALVYQKLLYLEKGIWRSGLWSSSSSPFPFQLPLPPPLPFSSSEVSYLVVDWCFHSRSRELSEYYISSSIDKVTTTPKQPAMRVHAALCDVQIKGIKDLTNGVNIGWGGNLEKKKTRK